MDLPQPLREQDHFLDGLPLKTGKKKQHDHTTTVRYTWKNQNAIAKTKIKQEGTIRKEKQCTMDIAYHWPGPLETSGHHVTITYIH